MHSDWLLGYMFEYYLSHSQLDEGEHNLMGMKTYPSCGNITIATGAVRPCTQFSDTCHNQNPKDMEALAITSYAQSPRSYKSVPKMEMTELDAAMDVIEEERRLKVVSMISISPMYCWLTLSLVTLPSSSLPMVYVDPMVLCTSSTRRTITTVVSFHMPKALSTALVTVSL